MTLYWANFQFAQRNPGGNDFLARWMGARAVLRGVSPYAEEVGLATQRWMYGRPADPALGDDEGRFAYPAYSLAVFLPFAWEDYTSARAAWMTFCEILLAASAVLGALLVGGFGGKMRTLAWVSTALLGYFGVRAVVNGNPVLISLFLVSWSAWSVKTGKEVLAGFLLGFSLIKPQVAVLPVLWIFLWNVAQLRHRLVGAFLVTAVGMVVGGEVLVPGWVGQHAAEVLRYTQYTEPGTPYAALRALAGDPGGWLGLAVSAAALTALLTFWGRNIRREVAFLDGLGWTIILAPFVGIPSDPGNQILLVLPFAFLLGSLAKGGACSGTAWYWTLLSPLAGLWVLFLLTVRAGPQPVQNPVMMFPFPFFLMAIWLVQMARRKRLSDAAAAEGLPE